MEQGSCFFPSFIRGRQRMFSTQGAGAAGGSFWWLPSGDSGGVESEPSGQWWPGSPLPQGAWISAFGEGCPCAGTYHRTCRGSSGLGSTPPPGQCPCHTACGDSGSSHTLRGRGGRGHVSHRHLGAGILRNTLAKEGVPPSSSEVPPVSSDTPWGPGEKTGLLKSPRRTTSGGPHSALGGTSDLTVSEP